MCGNAFTNPVKTAKNAFVPIRDAVETAAPIVADYWLPGSSLLTDRLMSKGAQKNLDSPLGEIAQVATSAGGAGFGSDITGIPASGGYTGAANALGGVVGDSTLGTDIGSSISGAFSGAPAAAATSGAEGLSAPVSAGASAASTAAPDAFGLTDSASQLAGNYDPAAAVGSSGSGAFAVPAASGVAPAASSGTSLSDFINHQSMAGVKDAILKNPSAALSALGVAGTALKGNQLAKGEKQLQQEAAGMQGQGAQLENYLQTGTLPPGVQTSINQSTEAAKASIRSEYAARGMSGSSAEQQDLANADAQARTQGASIAMQLLNTGINESSLSAQLYEKIMQNSMQNDQNLQSAITGFASSMAGTSPNSKGGININLNGTPATA